MKVKGLPPLRNLLWKRGGSGLGCETGEGEVPCVPAASAVKFVAAADAAPPVPEFVG